MCRNRFFLYQDGKRLLVHAEFVLDLNDWVRNVFVGVSTRAQLHRLLRLRVYVKLRAYDIVRGV